MDVEGIWKKIKGKVKTEGKRKFVRICSVFHELKNKKELWWNVMKCDEMWWNVMKCDDIKKNK